MLAVAWFALCGGCIAWGATETPEVGLSFGWDSAYVSEGRDNLESGGLVSGAFDLTWKSLVVAGWAAHGDSVDYREYNLCLSGTFAVGTVATTWSYTRLEFDGDGQGPGDNELGISIAVPIPGEFVVELGARYSTQAAGTFYEVIARRGWTLGKSGLVITPHVLLGVDQGYATSEYDGLNHLEAGVSLEFPLRDGLVGSFFCTRCWAMGDIDREGGGDVTWGGAGVQYGF